MSDLSTISTVTSDHHLTPTKRTQHDACNLLTAVRLIIDRIRINFHTEVLDTIEEEYRSVEKCLFKHNTSELSTMKLIHNTVIPKIKSLLCTKKEFLHALSTIEKIANTVKVLLEEKEANISVSIHALLRDIEDFFKIYTADSGIDFQTVFYEDIQLSLPPEHFKAAIYNILKNAAESITSSKGKGRILLQCYLNREKNVLEVSVSDNGGGMSPEQIANYGIISQSSKSESHGIGALNVKQFVTNQKATLTLASILDVGTCVTIAFPTKE